MKPILDMKAIVILSGGLDSTVLLHHAREIYDVFALSFDYGQKHRKELQASQEACQPHNIPHKIIRLDFMPELCPSAITTPDAVVPEGHYESDTMKLTVVPNRNMIFISLAVAHALSVGAGVVMLGIHSGDHSIYPDCRPLFALEMRRAVHEASEGSVYLSTPFLVLDKEQILRRGIGLGVDFSKTWTCYNGREKACGKCGSCVERLEAFAGVGVEDPLVYE